jgi:hypothetical protein
MECSSDLHFEPLSRYPPNFPLHLFAAYTLTLSVCPWSAWRLNPNSLSKIQNVSLSPFPRYGHALPATATAAGELFFFGGFVLTVATLHAAIYMRSQRRISPQLSCEPTKRFSAHIPDMPARVSAILF